MITIYDAGAKDCILKLYNEEAKGWDTCAEGSLPKCLKQADLVCAKEIESRASQYQTKKTIVTGADISEADKEAINAKLANDMNPYALTEDEKKDICKLANELIAQLSNLQGKVEARGDDDCITLHKITDKKNNPKWLQINMHDKDGDDCELVICKSGRLSNVYYRGNLLDCLESAEALSYVI